MKKKVINFDIPQDKMQQVFEIIDTLVNDQEEIIALIQPHVIKIINQGNIVDDVFVADYDEAFEVRVLSELIAIIQDRFNLNYEDAAIMLDKDFLKLINVYPIYFTKENYNGSNTDSIYEN